MIGTRGGVIGALNDSLPVFTAASRVPTWSEQDMTGSVLLASSPHELELSCSVREGRLMRLDIFELMRRKARPGTALRKSFLDREMFRS